MDKELFDAKICEKRRRGLFVLIQPKEHDLPLGHLAYVHNRTLPRDRRNYKVGDLCKVRLSLSNRCYANLPRLPKKAAQALRERKWQRRLKWKEVSNKLFFYGQMSSEQLAELRGICGDPYFRHAIDTLYRHSHSLYAEIVDLDLWKGFEESHNIGERVEGTIEDIRGKIAVIGLGPGVRTEIQLRDLAYNPPKWVQRGDKVKVSIEHISAKDGRIDVDPVLPTEDLEEQFPVGSTVKGKVIDLKPYGAFVEIAPEIVGLVPKEEMSWCEVRRPSDVVDEGDTVTVRILAIHPDRKIDLGMRTEENDPERRYPPCSRVSVKVVKLLPKCALARLEPGIVGLIHISELAWDWVDHPREVVHEGEELTVHVRKVYRNLDVEGHPWRLYLSLKRAFQAEMVIPTKDIGRLIGRGGRTIKPIEKATKTEIKVNDEGNIRIWGASPEGINTAQDQIKKVVPQAEVVWEN